MDKHMNINLKYNIFFYVAEILNSYPFSCENLFSNFLENFER